MFHGLAKWVTALSRPVKRSLMVGVDVLAVPVALVCAVLLRHEGWPISSSDFAALALVGVATAISTFTLAGLYHSVVRFLGADSIYAIFAGSVLAACAVAVVDLLGLRTALGGSTYVVFMLTAGVAVGSSRFFARQLLLAHEGDGAEPLVIFGAGASGRQIAAALAGNHEYRPFAFVDDQRALQGALIGGLQVHAPSALPTLIRKRKGVSVLLAIPAASRKRRQEILNSLVPLGVHVRSLPDMSEIISGRARAEDIRELDVTDILGREAVSPHNGLFAACIRNKSVMVTGAGGSIGSEICRQIVRNQPRRLVLLEMSEIALYNIERELSSLIGSEGLCVELVPLLGDAKRRDRVLAAMQTMGVQTVYHAAAYKHVPIVEQNVVEGVQNNIFSTWVTAESAMEAGVETFVLVSTDKAVNPPNVMGATKRAAEMVLQAMQGRGGRTRFAMVRFGNVLASSGSVVPLFQEQLRKGGPVTVTHPDVIRYFMTIPEAAQLVIQAGAMGQGGDVFVLDMGAPVRIVDLARRMISLAGRSVRDAGNPHGDVEIQFTGLRPAEKLFEELLIGNNVSGTEHPSIMRAVEHHLPWPQLEPLLIQLAECARVNDVARLLATLRSIVAEYKPDPSFHDLVWNARTTRGGMPNSASAGQGVAERGAKVTPLPIRRSRPGDQTIP